MPTPILVILVKAAAGSDVTVNCDACDRACRGNALMPIRHLYSLTAATEER